ncbi:MAG: fibrobacter succinogenes major paralogous domain-containing protein [Bacteroidetes bacterium]|nr:fibrobacter succinogenes major paralogous domain-containing protein [Bacteroidota bacterium]
MKVNTFIIIAIMCLADPPLTQSQDKVEMKRDSAHFNIYRTWITPVKSGHTFTGALYSVKDSSVLITNSFSMNDYVSGKYKSTAINVKSIMGVDLRKNNRKMVGVLIGTFSGLAAGITIGILAGSSNTGKNTSKAGGIVNGALSAGAGATLAIGTTLLGISLGAIIGGHKKHFEINGNMGEYERQRRELEHYSITYNRYGIESAVTDFSHLKDSVTDTEGNVYHLLALGDQVWMAENLRVTRFPDGTAITGSTKGRFEKEILYNWQSVTDTRHICPAGWHVPTMAEWASLCSKLGGENYAAAKLDGIFTARGGPVKWWSSTSSDAENALCFYCNLETAIVSFFNRQKATNLSVRCIRD